MPSKRNRVAHWTLNGQHVKCCRFQQRSTASRIWWMNATYTSERTNKITDATMNNRRSESHPWSTTNQVDKRRYRWRNKKNGILKLLVEKILGTLPHHKAGSFKIYPSDQARSIRQLKGTVLIAWTSAIAKEKGERPITTRTTPRVKIRPICTTRDLEHQPGK